MQLKYYSGNYDQYVKTRAELEENQMKRYQSEQQAMADMKDYIARFGHGRFVFVFINEIIWIRSNFKIKEEGRMKSI